MSGAAERAQGAEMIRSRVFLAVLFLWTRLLVEDDGWLMGGAGE